MQECPSWLVVLCFRSFYFSSVRHNSFIHNYTTQHKAERLSILSTVVFLRAAANPRSTVLLFCRVRERKSAEVNKAHKKLAADDKLLNFIIFRWVLFSHLYFCLILHMAIAPTYRIILVLFMLLLFFASTPLRKNGYIIADTGFFCSPSLSLSLSFRPYFGNCILFSQIRIHRTENAPSLHLRSSHFAVSYVALFKEPKCHIIESVVYSTLVFDFISCLQFCFCFVCIRSQMHTAFCFCSIIHPPSPLPIPLNINFFLCHWQISSANSRSLMLVCECISFSSFALKCAFGCCCCWLYFLSKPFLVFCVLLIVYYSSISKVNVLAIHSVNSSKNPFS